MCFLYGNAIFLETDEMVFRKKLTDWFLQSEKENQRIQSEASKFIDATVKFLMVKENLLQAMTPTRVKYK